MVEERWDECGGCGGTGGQTVVNVEAAAGTGGQTVKSRVEVEV